MVIVTRNPGYLAPGCRIAHSLEEAVALAGYDPEVFVIGGAALYREALKQIAARVYVTEVHAEFEGDARFPDFNVIIPRNYTTRTVLDTAAFLRALKPASLFARDVNDRVTLHIEPGGDTTPGRVIIRATSAETGDNVSELDALVEGTALDIAFNSRFLADVLSVIDTPQVVLETTRSDRSPSSGR